MEIWKGLIYQANDYSSMFEISNEGNLRNIKTKKQYKIQLLKSGYSGVCVSLGSRNSKKLIKIHRAVSETFIPNPLNLLEINHKDGHKENNHIDNLEWCTRLYNMRHAVKNNLIKYNYGEENFASILKKEDIKYIRKYYIPGDKTYGSRALAREFNVNHTLILKIVNKKLWKHID